MLLLLRHPLKLLLLAALLGACAQAFAAPPSRHQQARDHDQPARDHASRDHADRTRLVVTRGRDVEPLRHAGDDECQLHLRESEAVSRKLSLVASHTSNAVAITDSTGRIEWVNQAFTEMTGYLIPEIHAFHLIEVLRGPKTDVVAQRRLEDQMIEQRGFATEVFQYRKSGEMYWTSLEMQPVFSEDNELINWIAIQADITERRLGEEALMEASVRLTLTLEAANMALWDWNVNTGVVHMSDVWSTILGGAKTETVTTLAELAQIIDPATLRSSYPDFVALLKGTSPTYRAVHRVRALDGEWRFTDLGDLGCKIDFRLHYEFSSRLLETVVGSVFGYIANTLVDAFVKRARQVYA